MRCSYPLEWQQKQKLKQTNKKYNNQVKMWRNQNTPTLLMGIENGVATLAKKCGSP